MLNLFQHFFRGNEKKSKFDVKKRKIYVFLFLALERVSKKEKFMFFFFLQKATLLKIGNRIGYKWKQLL